MTFAERLVYLRKSRGLTQKQVYEAIGMSMLGYQRYEYGQREPAYQNLIALAEYFQVSIDFLTGRTNCPDILTYDKDGNPVIIEAMKPHSDKPDVNK